MPVGEATGIVEINNFVEENLEKLVVHDEVLDGDFGISGHASLFSLEDLNQI